jgi:hypothetical protein
MNEDIVFNMIRRNADNFNILNGGIFNIEGYNCLIYTEYTNIPENVKFVFFNKKFNKNFINNINFPNNIIGINFANNLEISLENINFNNNLKYIGGINYIGNLYKLPNSLEYLYFTPNFNDNLNNILNNNYNLKKLFFNNNYLDNYTNLDIINKNLVFSFSSLENSNIPSYLNNIEIRYFDKIMEFPENIKEVKYYIYDSEYSENEDKRLYLKLRCDIDNLNDFFKNNVKKSKYLNSNCKITENFIY